jgi:hypothetical protein
VAAAAAVDNRLQPAGHQRRARRQTADPREPGGPFGTGRQLGRRRPKQRAGIAAVGDDQDVLRRDRLQAARDVGVRYPQRVAVLVGVHRQPESGVGRRVQYAVPGVVDQQVVALGQVAPVGVQRPQDLQPRRVDQQIDGEAVLLAQHRRGGHGVVDGGLELRQVPVVVVADDQRVVAAEVDCRHRRVLRRRRSADGRGDNDGGDGTTQHGLRVLPRPV